MVSALPSVLEVPSSILSDPNVCSDFSLICVAVSLNNRKLEHRQREGVKSAQSASIDNSSMNYNGLLTFNKETFTFFDLLFESLLSTIWIEKLKRWK